MDARTELRTTAEANGWHRALDAGFNADTFRKGETYVHVKFNDNNGITHLSTQDGAVPGKGRREKAARLLTGAQA